MPGRKESVDPAAYPEEQFDLYSIPAFDSGRPEVLPGAHIGSAKQLVIPGDVLLSRIVPHIRRSWVVDPSSGRRQIASGEWIVFRSPRLYPPYLRHLLVANEFHAKFMKTVSGVGGSLLRARPSYVAEIEVLFPPLPEQRRVAAILEKADALRNKRRAALAQLDTFSQSMFIDMFGDGAQWAPSTVAMISSHRTFACIGGPFGSELTQADYTALGVPVLRGRNLSTPSPFVDEEGFVFVSERKARELERNTAERGDVVVSQRGARLSGQVAMIPATSRYSKYVVSQSQMKVSPDPTKIDPLFLVYFFRSPGAVRRMERRMISTGVPHINLGILRDFVVPVPPLQLQRVFARRVEGIERLKRSHQKALTKVDALIASLQHRAFRGEL